MSDTNKESKNEAGGQDKNTDADGNPKTDEEMEADRARRAAEEAAMPTIVTDKTSILLTRSHDDSKGSEDCSYCHGKRTLYSGEEETGLKYHKLGFTTNKFRVNDYETCLQQGFTRCGSYVYIRNQMKSCCEIYQYKVKI